MIIVKKWIVTLINGKEKSVEAWSVTVTQTGELLFRRQDGDTARIIAGGAWTECEQISRDEQG